MEYEQDPRADASADDATLFRRNIRYLSAAVPPEREGTVLGSFLRHSMHLSDALIKRIKWMDDGICLDGRRVTTRAILHSGQTVTVRLSDACRRSGLVSVPGPLSIVYEDDDLLVLNKAPGISVHPGQGHFFDTLGNYLLSYYDAREIPADFHPVHRLDRGTSGLMIVAKHTLAQDRLRQALHTPDFQRIYLAVCDGIPASRHGLIDAPLSRAGDSIIRQEISPDGRSARTEYRVLLHTDCRALLRLRLFTGRTHQIRTHLASIGHPLTGDFLYGTEDHNLIARPALHSAALSFRHPITGQMLHFALPLPPDMARLLAIN